MAAEGDLDVVGGEAAAVVLDAHQLLAAGGEFDGDGGGAGVEGVLHQLLDHRERALDHLAGGYFPIYVLS